jgi:hypothetical protein
MRMKFTIEVEVARTSGKFVSKDEIRESIREEIEGADPGSITVGDNSEYETTSWSVEDAD